MAKYGMKIKVTITKDDEDFAETDQEYHNMNYDAMQLVQGTLVRSLLELGDAKLSNRQPQANASTDRKF